MKNAYLSLIWVVLFLPLCVVAEWIPVNPNKSANTPPEVTLVSDDQSGTVIHIDISGFQVNEFVTENKTYQSIDLLSDGMTSETGYPELPYISKVLAIPDQASVSVEIIESGEVLTFDNYTLAPVRESWIEGTPAPAYAEFADVYASGNPYPEILAEVDDPSVFRDFRIVRVAVYPVRYLPGEKQLQVVSSVTVKINYGKGTVINPKTSPQKKIAPSFGELYRSFIFNYQSVLDQLYGGEEDGMELMLCIMPDNFVESFQPYADWKRQSGINIHVTKFSDIGANATNPTIIKNHITDAYYNWADPPTYVLLVGDAQVFPYKIITYPDYSFPNEDYFVEIEGNDYFPELMIGRFTNQQEYRLQVMVNKFKMYEKTPYVANTDWFKKGICCSNNYYESQVETKRFAASMMLEYGNFSHVDTMMSDGNGWGWGCTYDVQDIVTAINQGRSFLNYRGEGWYSGWSASCYDFNVSDVSNLNNGEKFTFVTSIGCGVAGFHNSSGNCFGEEWIQLGTLTAPRGGVAFLGPVSNTHTTYNNKIDKGIYVGMFQEGLNTPGQAMMRGKLYMYNVFGNEFWVEYHYRIYCVLGDPSLRVWKEVPRQVNVAYIPIISVGVNNLEFTVTYASNGLPVPNAQVCLTGEDIFLTGVSNAMGKVNLDITLIQEEDLVVTVTGGDVYPYQGIIEVLQPTQLVEPEGEPVLVEFTGNMDGNINPDETFNITYSLKNWGTSVATNVQATLISDNTDLVEVTNAGPISFGNINPGSITTGNPFQFHVMPYCPVGYIMTLQLLVTSGSNSWDFYYEYEVKGCVLELKNFIVHDPAPGNHNYRMDPGESVSLVLSIRNTGVDIAPNVAGIISTSDPYITIDDSTAYFGTLAINSSSASLEDFFEISVASNCPVNYMATYLLKLYTQNGNYPYQTYLQMQVPVSKPIPTDYTGPDAYGYYVYASNDAFFDQTPVYNWVEIETQGIFLNIPGVSDYTETVSLPFTFKYYGVNYSVIRLSTDGWMALGGGNETAPVNTALPNTDNVNNMVAPFWDDLYDIEVPGSKIYYYSDNVNHRFIVEWDSIAHNDFGSEPKWEVFQVILLDPVYYPTPTGDGEIIFQYRRVEDPSNMTVGIENNLQTIGIQYVFNESYHPTASPVTENYALKFTTRPPSVSVLVTGEEEYPGLGSGSNRIELGQNQPNPFRDKTVIDYRLPETSLVSLEIFNVKGELVRTLVNSHQPAGKHSVVWDGTNNLGNATGSGLYFYRLQTDTCIKTLKMFRIQ